MGTKIGTEVEKNVKVSISRISAAALTRGEKLGIKFIIRVGDKREKSNQLTQLAIKESP